MKNIFSGLLKKCLIFGYLLFACTSVIAEEITLDFPQTFVLGSDLDVTNTGFRILSSDVTLDLNSHVLTDGLDAIVIKDNVNNITIKNGIIDSCANVGIIIGENCNGINLENIVIKNSQKYGIYVNDGTHMLFFENIKILLPVIGGIFLDGNNAGNKIWNSVIKNVFVSGAQGSVTEEAFGFKAIAINDCIIDDCFFNACDAQMFNNGYGLICDNASNLLVRNCTVANNGGNEFAVGCALLQCQNCLLQNCIAFGTTARSSSSSSFSTGFLINQSTGINIIASESISNKSEQSKALGYYFIDGDANMCKNCLAVSNVGFDESSGFELSGETNSAIDRCKTNLNVTTNSGAARGVYLSNNCDTCYVANNVIYSNNGASSSRGIEDSRSNSTSLILKNKAFNNGTNYSVDYPLTISLPRATGSLSSTLVGMSVAKAGEFVNTDIDT